LDHFCENCTKMAVVLGIFFPKRYSSVTELAYYNELIINKTKHCQHCCICPIFEKYCTKMLVFAKHNKKLVFVAQYIVFFVGSNLAYR